MADGQVTAEEVNSGIAAMQPLFDKMERVMAEAGAAAKALEGGVDVRNANSGTIIQQLSGSDRDWFTEVFKDGFSKLNQVFELKELTVAQIQATQIIVQSMTYHFHNSTISITADKNVNLKEVLTEVTKEVLQGD